MVTRPRQSHQSLVCEDCAIARACNSGRQLHAHAGPAYDNWVAGMARFADRLRAGTGAA